MDRLVGDNTNSQTQACRRKGLLTCKKITQMLSRKETYQVMCVPKY